MTNTDGQLQLPPFAPIFNGLREHIRNGEMTPQDLGIYVLLHLWVGYDTGICRTCGPDIVRLFGGRRAFGANKTETAARESAMRSMERLRERHFINYRCDDCSVLHPVLIHKYLVRTGANQGRYLDAFHPTSVQTPESPRYLRREESFSDDAGTTHAQQTHSKRTPHVHRTDSSCTVHAQRTHSAHISIGEEFKTEERKTEERQTEDVDQHQRMYECDQDLDQNQEQNLAEDLSADSGSAAPDLERDLQGGADLEEDPDPDPDLERDPDLDPDPTLEPETELPQCSGGDPMPYTREDYVRYVVKEIYMVVNKPYSEEDLDNAIPVLKPLITSEPDFHDVGVIVRYVNEFSHLYPMQGKKGLYTWKEVLLQAKDPVASFVKNYQFLLAHTQKWADVYAWEQGLDGRRDRDGYTKQQADAMMAAFKRHYV